MNGAREAREKIEHCHGNGHEISWTISQKGADGSVWRCPWLWHSLTVFIRRPATCRGSARYLRPEIPGAADSRCRASRLASPEVGQHLASFQNPTTLQRRATDTFYFEIAASFLFHTPNLMAIAMTMLKIFSRASRAPFTEKIRALRAYQ